MGTMAIRAQLAGTQLANVAAGVAVLGLVAGCGSDGDRGAHSPPQARLELAAAVPAQAEAAGVRLEVFRCKHDQPALRRDVSFSAGDLGALGAFSDKPIRLDTDHFFSQTGLTFRPGCYRASATPLDANNEPIEACTPAKTARLPLGPASRRYMLLAARCGDGPADTPVVDGRLDFPPMIDDLDSRFDAESDTFEVCAGAFDPDGAEMRFDWRARTERGQTRKPEEVWVRERAAKTRRVCARFDAGAAPLEITASVVDGTEHPWRGFVSHEAYRVHRFGIATPSRDEASVRLAAPAHEHTQHDSASCHSGAVAGWIYWIRRDGELLAPTRNLDEARPGDSVEVELEVEPGCESLAAEFVSYRGSVKSPGSLARVFERDAATVGPGTHVLWVDVPRERPFTLALAVETDDGYEILDHVDTVPSLVDVAH